jgi:hypothetical protein
MARKMPTDCGFITYEINLVSKIISRDHPKKMEENFPFFLIFFT